MYTVQGIIILFIIPCAVYTQAKLCSRLVELSMERVSKPAALSLEQLQHQQRFAFCCFFSAISSATKSRLVFPHKTQRFIGV